ncbi:MAG: DUF2339 domain-containing protein [bacterium]|nr:DUF2339 domain-containing protein [bacterium]
MELLTLAALALAVFALRRTRDHARLRERLEALEAQVAALRGAAVIPAGDAQEDATPAPDGWSAPTALEPPSADAGAPPTVDAPEDAPRSEAASDADGDAPPGAPEPEPPPSAWSQIDWERWIGVRGAAVLGGGVLALAGLFFFRYSIEHGLIPPWLRVVMGTLTGLGCIVAAERGLRRDYGRTADALAGAGVVLLYASFWAAGPRYGIVGNLPTFFLLTLVTVAGGVLATRHRSQVIAVLGLLGGFLTPVFTASDADRPLGLFGYLLLLDLGLLYLARQQGWPWLAVLGLAGTAIYQGLWIGVRMGPGQLLLGLTVLATFALTFAVATPRGGPRDRRWLAAQAGGVLVPFTFAIHLAARADLPGLLPLGALLAILSLAAAWTARVQSAPAIGLAAATAALGVLLMWLGQHGVPPGTGWTFALVSIALALPFHVAVSREPEDARWRGVAPAAAVAALGHVALQLGAGVAAADPRPGRCSRRCSAWPRCSSARGRARAWVRSSSRAPRASRSACWCCASSTSRAPVGSGRRRGWRRPPPSPSASRRRRCCADTSARGAGTCAPRPWSRWRACRSCARSAATPPAWSAWAARCSSAPSRRSRRPGSAAAPGSSPPSSWCRSCRRAYPTTASASSSSRSVASPSSPPGRSSCPHGCVTTAGPGARRRSRPCRGCRRCSPPGRTASATSRSASSRSCSRSSSSPWRRGRARCSPTRIPSASRPWRGCWPRRSAS